MTEEDRNLEYIQRQGEIIAGLRDRIAALETDQAQLWGAVQDLLDGHTSVEARLAKVGGDVRAWMGSPGARAIFEAAALLRAKRLNPAAAEKPSMRGVDV